MSVSGKRRQCYVNNAPGFLSLAFVISEVCGVLVTYPLCRHIIIFFINLLNDLRLCTGRVQLNAEFRRDLRWWQAYLPKWNGTSTFLETHWSSPEVLQLYRCSYLSRLRRLLPRPLVPVRRARLVRKISYQHRATRNGAHSGSVLCVEKVLLHCDNLEFVQAWEKLGSKCRNVLACMRLILAVAAEGNFNLTIKHVEGCNNVLADVLSRFQESRFWQLTPQAQLHPDQCVDTLGGLWKVMIHQDRNAHDTHGSRDYSKHTFATPPVKPTQLAKDVCASFAPIKSSDHGLHTQKPSFLSWNFFLTKESSTQPQTFTHAE